MEYYLTIPVKLDNLNDYINACRRHRHCGARIKDDNQEYCRFEIRNQLRDVHIKAPVYVEYTWYEKNKMRDLDNISSFGRKVIQDALVECKVLDGDGWKHIVGFSDRFYVDKHHPRIEVLIREVRDAEQNH